MMRQHRAFAGVVAAFAALAVTVNVFFVVRSVQVLGDITALGNTMQVSTLVLQPYLFESLQRLRDGQSVLSIQAPTPVSEVVPPHPAAAEPTYAFPILSCAVFPVTRVPDWGAMRTPEEWNRTYDQLTEADYVSVPAYDLGKLTTPMATFADRADDASIAAITQKLFYSTRYFGAYDVDVGEFTGLHDGIDLKLPVGTPIAAIGAGRVQSVSRDGALGLHVIIEHHLPDGEKIFSIYGHLGSVSIKEGADVTAGQVIGAVGMTGETTGPHLHLQIDRDDGMTVHQPVIASSIPTREEAAQWSINPIHFIRESGSCGSR